MKVQPGFTLAERMKKFEDISRYKVSPKQPVMIRLSARGFSKFRSQNGLTKFDSRISNMFMKTMLQVGEAINQIEYGYHYSDEVIFFLKDYKTKKQEQYFNGNIQNINSLITSKFTYLFNKNSEWIYPVENPIPVEFTCKVFTLPMYEVANYFINHQRESIKFIVNEIAKDLFTQEELFHKGTPEKIEMIQSRDGLNYTTVPYWKGVAIKKIEVELRTNQISDEDLKILVDTNQDVPPETIIRTKLIVDVDLPMFNGSRDEIEKIVFSGEGITHRATQLELEF